MSKQSLLLHNKKSNYQEKLKSRKKIVLITQKLKRGGKKIVMTGGIFDILHPGHTRYLQKAKKLGDVLIVAVNSDSSTKKNKGPKRPINNQGARTEIIAALESVDYVTIFNEVTPEKIIAQAEPNIWVKGGHYKKEKMPETLIVKRYGGKVKILPLEKGFSVTGLVEKIIKEKPIKVLPKESFSR